VIDAKRALRAEMRAVRAAIAADPAARAERSSRIWAGIVSILDLGADVLESANVRAQKARVMLFEGLPTEPDTSAWIEAMAASGCAVFTPEVDGPDLRIVPGDLDPRELDVVVVPGLAFTVDGHRLGQGGGHYDRFLPRLRPDCVTIGACFAEQVVESLPIDAHDIHVDHVVSA
jgi:5-formyltetrahydrofolate cyclo-ligase